MQETYTLGYDRAAMAFVERRRLDINGAFFLPYLATGMHVLDCGCGPGTDHRPDRLAARRQRLRCRGKRAAAAGCAARRHVRRGMGRMCRPQTECVKALCAAGKQLNRQ